MKTVKVYSGNGMSASLGELLPQFERAHGCTVDVTFAPAQVMLREVKAGRSADLGLIGSGVMDQVVKLGNIVPASVRTFTRNGIGVGVLAGAPKPDLSSVESFKRALLNAKSVAYTSEGASGIYFAGLIERLGIAELIKAKAKTRSGGLIAEFVVSGDAEIAVSLSAHSVMLLEVALIAHHVHNGLGFIRAVLQHLQRQGHPRHHRTGILQCGERIQIGLAGSHRSLQGVDGPAQILALHVQLFGVVGDRGVRRFPSRTAFPGATTRASARA